MSNVLAGRRVLVVEDEVLVSWILEDMLADLGCEVVGPAARVQQAISIIEGEGVDIAVVDINLNGEKSYPVADALREHGIPFVFSSAYTKDTMPAHLVAIPLLQKPFEQAILRDALGQLISVHD